MKKYTSLIRKLVDSTAEAELSDRDIADVLKVRCFNDTSLVRQTLMNAVCDPRFRLKASLTGTWKAEAKTALMHLAERLEAMQQPSEDAAYYVLEGFLSEWMHRTFKGCSKKTRLGGVVSISSVEGIRRIAEALNNLQEEEESDDAIVNAAPTEEDDIADQQRFCPESQEKESEAYLEQFRRRNIEGMGCRPTNSINTRRIEERFLERIPYSLVELARLIGRMGNDGRQARGRFLRAGKSDIAGVTVGNDICALVPSEVSILAERRTESVFYHRFVSQKLQLFASASSSPGKEKHQDGPVVICVDASGSMGGEPIMVARALAIAVCIIAWKRGRDVIVVKYSDTYESLRLGHHSSQLRRLSKFLSHVPNAGNNENSMFRWLFRNVLPDLEAYSTADILCISDFGWCPLSGETLDIIQQQKDSGMLFYGLNVSSGSTLLSSRRRHEIEDDSMKVCDSLWVYEDGEVRKVSPV